MSAKIIPLPERGDDTIPFRTGLPLIDADPAMIARCLANEPWEKRALFFNNVINEGMEFVANTVEYAVTEDGPREFIEWAMLKMHERIGQTLDLLGNAKPSEDVAAGLYILSLNPAHRQAAREYFCRRGKGYLSAQAREVITEFPSLLVFFNMSEISRPGLGYAWERGVPEKCAVMFRDPNE